MYLGKIYRKIAIAGTARAGKTVFLTSLINHLRQHRVEEFIIGKRAKITKFVKKRTSDARSSEIRH